MQVSGTITLIALSWSPPNPIHVNGIIDHYRIRVQEVYTRREINLIAREDSIRVGPLHPYYIYTCQIAAFTIGLGPFSSPFSVQAGESGKFKMFCAHPQVYDLCVYRTNGTTSKCLIRWSNQCLHYNYMESSAFQSPEWSDTKLFNCCDLSTLWISKSV